MIVFEQEPEICTDHVEINPELIYFAATLDYFLIYDFDNSTWSDIKGRLVIEQGIEHSFDKNGCLNLLVPGMAIQTGKWFTAENMNDVLDFYNTKEYLNYI